MTSQISIRSLLKLEIKQSTWMLALSALGQFLAGPVYYLLSVTTYSNREPLYNINRHCSFFDDGYFLMQLLVMLLAIGFSIFSYRYLFSKRMIDLYHSVPITRTKLFWVKYIHGLLVWALPFVISTLFVLLLSFLRLSKYLTLEYTGMLLCSLASCAILLPFCFFVFYHLFLAAAYLSGNILNLLTNLAVMGISIASIYALLLNCAECFFDTFCATPSNNLLDVILSLSPLVTPFYLYFYVKGGGFTTVVTEHPLLLITSLTVSLLLLGLAWLLCNKRPSELAERGTLNKVYKIPARIAATFMASIAISTFFSEIVSNEFGLGWGIFGAILGGILCFGALNSIYHTTIKSFFKNLPQMLGVTAASTLVIMAFQLDWFGYDTYLPDKEDIAGMAIYLSSFGDATNSVYLDPDSGWYYSTGNEMFYQEKLLTDQDICYDFLDLVINGESEGDKRFFYAKIQLTNGRTYHRQYLIDYADYQALAPFIESDDYKYTNYKTSTGLMGYPDTIDVNLRESQLSFTLVGDNLRTLMDAYKADFEEHYTLEKMSSYLYSASMELEYSNAEGSSFYSYLSIPEHYTRTMDYLQSMYPEYVPYITSSEQIVSITPYVSKSNLETFGSFRGYYGMDSVETNPENRENASETTVVIAENTEPQIAMTEAYPQSVKESTVNITDRELIEELYPLLYFGEYASSFGKRDYIYFADIQTKDGYYIRCWVKPNTVPEKIIEMMEETAAGLEE